MNGGWRALQPTLEWPEANPVKAQRTRNQSRTHPRGRRRADGSDGWARVQQHSGKMAVRKQSVERAGSGTPGQ